MKKEAFFKVFYFLEIYLKTILSNNDFSNCKNNFLILFLFEALLSENIFFKKMFL